MVKDAEKNAGGGQEAARGDRGAQPLDSLAYQVEKESKEWATRCRPT
jgi:hypothetical protein